MATIDLSRIAPLILRENFLALLGFPVATIRRGYVPLRVTAREFFYFMYDPVREGQLTAKVPAGVINGPALNDGITDLGFVTPSRLGSVNLSGKPFNAFFVKEPSHMYQLFFGLAPSALRVFIQAPAATGQRNLEIDQWSATKLQFGWVDGFDTPLFAPGPNSEINVPPEFEFALGYGNPIPFLVDPLFLFVMNRLEVGVVTDADLVKKMIDGIVPTAIKTVGGIATYTYPIAKIYGIQPIPLGATLQEIKVALGVS